MGSPQKESDPSERGPSIGPVRRFGRYTLVKKLATGGMAEIWLARQRGLAGFNRFVVIKKILSHLSEQETFVRMFLDEARTSAQLNHPNIVQIFDLGAEGGAYFIAMEFIAGENLAAIAWRGMKRGQPFLPAYAARAIADAAKGLNYAHHFRGPDGKPLEIVHRDISPQNILVTYEGEVKLVDFGIAKAASKSEHTKTGMLKGKFSYMSPEQCLGAHVDMRSDIFALGILLYELCTGKRLFKHESELMILEMITKRTVVPPSQVAPGIAPELEAIIMRALEKDPSARFATAQEMQVALEEYLRDEAESATNADVAVYMRNLFADKIEEKRKLREIASRDDFEQGFGEEEATEQAVGPDGLRRRVVHGLPPSQLNMGARLGPIVQGLPPSAARGTPTMYPPSPLQGAAPSGTALPMAPVGTTPAGLPGSFSALAPGYPSGVIYPPGQAQESTWAARIVIFGAMIVILVTLAILIQQLTQSGDTNSSNALVTSPPPAVKTGSLTLESVPSGAKIWLDGQPMNLESGEQAKTPSDLKSLRYGTRYTVMLEKDGYRAFTREVLMEASTDGQHIRPTLEAFPGSLRIEVAGERNREVRVLIDGTMVGRGPEIRVELPGDSEPSVQGQLEGMTCNSERPKIRAGALTSVKIECSKTPPRIVTTRPPSNRTVRNPADPENGNTSASASASSKTTRESREPGGGCEPRTDVPPGWVTISTTPYSDIFWKGQNIGSTPLAKHRAPAGCFEIEAVNQELGKRKKFKLNVEPGQVVIYKLTL